MDGEKLVERLVDNLERPVDVPGLSLAQKFKLCVGGEDQVPPTGMLNFFSIEGLRDLLFKEGLINLKI